MAVETANTIKSRRRFGLRRVFVFFGLVALLSIMGFPGLIQVYDNTGAGAVQGNDGFSMVDIILDYSAFMETYVTSNTAFALFLGMIGSFALVIVVWSIWLVGYERYDAKWPLFIFLAFITLTAMFILYVDIVDSATIWGYSYIPGQSGKFLTSFLAIPKAAYLYPFAIITLWMIAAWKSKKQKEEEDATGL